MSDSFTEKSIFASDVPADPVRCPQCKGGNLNLKGYLKREYDEVQDKGTMVSHKLGDDLFQEVDHVECRDCQIRFTIISRQVAELETQVTEFEAMLATAMGQCKQC